ncbi:hypothetical protein [Yersinia thracica]|uniref:hypothetical protein n=1 Tax=Yersinia thracica TaxID=2890319 RepID=UPI0011A79AFB|nr:hypothetical protein [Yersinia thracica]
MNRISYPISHLELHNVVNSLKMSNAPIEKRQFYIDGARFYDDKKVDKKVDEKVDEKVEERVLAELVNRYWLKEGDEKENERRVTVLENMSQYSMATVAVQHSQTIYPYLHYEGISMEFNSDSDYGLEMRYSVPYSDGKKRLFTLECQLFLGENFELNEVQSRVYYHFEKQCPSELRRDVNRNSILEMIFNWFKELFTPNSYAAANTMSPSKNEYKGWDPQVVNSTNPLPDKEILDQKNIANKKDEDDVGQFLKSIIQGFDELNNDIDRELDKCSDNKIEKRMEELSEDLQKCLDNDKEDLEKIENDAVKFNQYFEGINDGYKQPPEIDLEWDDAI